MNNRNTTYVEVTSWPPEGRAAVACRGVRKFCNNYGRCWLYALQGVKLEPKGAKSGNVWLISANGGASNYIFDIARLLANECRIIRNELP